MHATQGQPDRNGRGMAAETRGGFSLIEVSLALLVLGLGLMGVFHLFPSGLRASYDAAAETRNGQFADEVFNELYAVSAECEDWSSRFAPGHTQPFYMTNNVTSQRLEIRPNQVDYTLVSYPLDSREMLRYRMACGTVDGLVATCRLDVLYGRVGGMTNTFYTEFYNWGM